MPQDKLFYCKMQKGGWTLLADSILTQFSLQYFVIGSLVIGMQRNLICFIDEPLSPDIIKIHWLTDKKSKTVMPQMQYRQALPNFTFAHYSLCTNFAHQRQCIKMGH